MQQDQVRSVCFVVSLYIFLMGVLSGEPPTSPMKGGDDGFEPFDFSPKKGSRKKALARSAIEVDSDPEDNDDGQSLSKKQKKGKGRELEERSRKQGRRPSRRRQMLALV